ncbi:hypothetical protein GF312_16735 [Candidatus Poribacteria bacterium]|nr:hypothetical protein [Candidatus Poribacteria bacterium]
MMKMINKSFILYTIILVLILLVFSSCDDREELIPEEKIEEPVMVIAEANVDEATIGDKIRYNISVLSNPGVDVKMPEFGENLGGFGIKDFGDIPVKSYKDKQLRQKWYLLDTYITGSYNIPAPVVTYTGLDGEEKEVQGNEVVIEVKSVIADGEEPQDIKDIEEPVELPVDYSPYIWIGVIVFLVAGGITATVILLRRREKLKEEAPPRPAHEIAYEQLQTIADSNMVENKETDKYYVLLSSVVRHYLENRFGLHAPEMTTEEFLHAVVNSQDKDTIHLYSDLLRDFLVECDLVKFARYGPNEKQMQSAFESAKRFVDETRFDRMDAEEVEVLDS